MVMNAQDKDLAEHYKLYNQKTGKLISIPGMGVNFSRFDMPQTKAELRTEYGISEDEVLYIFAGEFSHRKNQKMLINAFAQAASDIPHAKLILAGEGTLLDDCKQLVQSLNLENQIYFPGHVRNMPVLYRMGDVCVSASKIEGLPFNIMEAMYCQLPCVVSDIKGHQDLIDDGQTGFLCSDELSFCQCIVTLYHNERMRILLGQSAKVNAERYRLKHVGKVILDVYETNL